MWVDVVPRHVNAFSFLFLFSVGLVARAAFPDSPDGMWLDLTDVDINTIPAKSADEDTFVRPNAFRAAWLDEGLLNDRLSFAPVEEIGNRDQLAKNTVTI